MRKENIIRIVGAVIAYSVFISARFLPYDISAITTQRHPIVILTSLGNIIGWLCGLIAVILVLLARSRARWFLTAYFILGLLSTSAAWLPFTNIMMKQIPSPYTKMIMIHFINLCILVTIFILFRKIGRPNTGVQTDAE